VLCDFAGVEDLSRESKEVLKAGEVVKWVARLVTSATVVAVENVMEAFVTTYRLDLVSSLLPPCFLLITSP
jgi:hypothetical protein